MHRLGVRILFLFAWLLTARTIAASATTARLLLPVETVKAGETFFAGIQLTMKSGWHTYWRNGGDSGAATSVVWQLPGGFTAGEIRWPVPERYEESGLTTYVYHDTVILLIPITVAPDAPPGPRDLSAKVSWLECEKLCLPGHASVAARLEVAAQNRPSPAASLLRAAEDRLPQLAPAGTATAAWEAAPAEGGERPVLVRWKTELPAGTVPDFFPFTGAGFEVGTATERLPADRGTVTLRKRLARQEGEWPGRIGGLLVALNAKGKPAHAVEVLLDLASPGSAAADIPAPAVGSRPNPSAGTGAGSTGVLSLASAVGLGFLGGLILNVMPCVLPVIALKILGFVRQAGSRPAEVRRLGLIYALGVWFSFLVLAGAVIAVKQAVGLASWGMQFGNPVFLVCMTTLILLVALSLFGVFEINVTGRALDSAGELTRKEGPAGAFFNGVLAVALATPCTAPFLAPALGYAFAADALTIAVVFTAVAAGLAAPYVLLSWQPAWLRFIPKPGPWMEHFKVAMGFPMLATAVWLYTLSAAHFGESGPLGLGAFLVGISVAAWIWGAFVQRGRTRQTLAMAAAALVAVAAYLFALERELNWRAPVRLSPPAIASPAPGRDEIPWQPWSREAVETARRAGHPVLVDFTADWCITCKVNERTAINIPSVRARLQEINAVTLKGDYTRTPPAITEELQRFKTAGVPLVLVYPKDPGRDPVVLPGFLTPGVVLDALNQAVL